MEFFINLWDLFIDMSFYIVIGLLFTGALHAFVDKDKILKHLHKQSTTSVIKASIFGVPLPLCSCGVVPTALYLRKNKASNGAVISFLTSTPQTGIDSLIATYGLMGPLFAVYRALAAFVSGVISGILTNIFVKKERGQTTMTLNTTTCGCSASNETSDTCGCESRNKTSFITKFKSIFTYAFGEFLDDIAGHFVIGLILAALIATFIPESWLTSFDNPLLTMIAMLIIGIPMYICSTASIPIALSLMMKGISPGAAFVFLFAGPVTNIASLTILTKSLGKKVIALYLGSVAFCSIMFGLLLDYIIEVSNYTGINSIINNTAEHHDSLYMVVVALIFGVIVARSLIKKYFVKENNCGCCHN